MAFIDLENPSRRNPCPPAGLIIRTRPCGRKGGETRYVEIRLGAALAKQMTMVMAKQAVRIRVGAGQDQGKLAIELNAKGKFGAKKQTSGDYLITLTRGALAGTLSADFPPCSFEAARFVPANGGDGPMAIIACSPAMMAAGGAKQ